MIGDGGKKEQGDVVAVERDGKERKDGGGTAKWMRWWDVQYGGVGGVLFPEKKG